ncbi:MAG TPA: nitroreductase family deazaflavin-dependent oxidoreductase [Chloroflexi bacterium]|nr:nitroreductase family deazaflavin-dependent oxidoreductase [Chloroflexota bacterium]
MARIQISRYRRATGPEQQRTFGFPALLLTTVGARTGTRRTVVVGGFPDGDDAWLVVASNAGAASHPAWFHNLARHPDQVWVQVGNRTLRVAGESLLDARREEALRSIYASAPRYASYQRKTDREIPVVRLTRAGDPS